MSIAWLAATVWAHSSGRDPVIYGIAAFMLAFIDAMLLGAWLSP